jgi:hypothetical protein
MKILKLSRWSVSSADPGTFERCDSSVCAFRCRRTRRCHVSAPPRIPARTTYTRPAHAHGKLDEGAAGQTDGHAHPGLALLRRCPRADAVVRRRWSRPTTPSLPDSTATSITDRPVNAPESNLSQISPTSINFSTSMLPLAVNDRQSYRRVSLAGHDRRHPPGGGRGGWTSRYTAKVNQTMRVECSHHPKQRYRDETQVDPGETAGIAIIFRTHPPVLRVHVLAIPNEVIDEHPPPTLIVPERDVEGGVPPPPSPRDASIPADYGVVAPNGRSAN